MFSLDWFIISNSSSDDPEGLSQTSSRWVCQFLWTQKSHRLSHILMTQANWRRGLRFSDSSLSQSHTYGQGCRQQWFQFEQSSTQVAGQTLTSTPLWLSSKSYATIPLPSNTTYLSHTLCCRTPWATMSLFISPIGRGIWGSPFLEQQIQWILNLAHPSLARSTELYDFITLVQRTYTTS